MQPESGQEAFQLFDGLPDGPLLHILDLATSDQLLALRLVCRRFKSLVDAALSPSLCIRAGSHLRSGGAGARGAIYRSRLEFTAAAARLLERRAPCLALLHLDFEAYGCVFASQLLQHQPLPQLAAVQLVGAETQHLAALSSIPRLQHVDLSRQGHGPSTSGPAAELLVAQLASLPLRSLKLSGYRVLPALLASVAAALPGLRELSLSVARVEGPSSRLDLAGLARLEQLESWELHLLRGPAAAPDITLSPLPPGATALRRLRSVALLHARPAEGEEDAFWGRLSLLPALEALGYVESVHSTRQPPPQLFHLASLTSLSIKIDGNIFMGDPPASTWTQLPELPHGALPRLTSLRLECVGLLALPALWCRPPLASLHINGLASERSFYTLRLPDELPRVAASLCHLALPRCGLWSLPDQVAQLTCLTKLDLRGNGVTRLPALGQLVALQELELFDSPATNAATALQGCCALRRLGLGSRHYARRRRASMDGGPLAGQDEEACRWQEAYLAAVRTALPWVPQVDASYVAASG